MIEIVPWQSLAEPETVKAAIERIFFAASGTQVFASEAARSVFCERWLGRYLDHDPGHVFVARAGSGQIVGYLVGSCDDPARTQRFADIGFFAQFSQLTRAYPAHLHVNLDANARAGGIGSALVEAFCQQVAAAGLPGVHVVTGRGVRNVGFYERLAFVERGAATFNGREIVFLGRELAGQRL